MFVQKTIEEQDAMSKEDFAAYKTAEKANEAKLRDEAIALEVKTKVEAAKKDLEATFGAEVAAQLKDLGQGRQEQSQTIKDVLEANKEEILEAISKGSAHEFEVTKADVLRSSVDNNSASMRDTEISPLASKKLTLYDLFRKVRVGRNNNGTVTYYDWDTATTARAAAMVAEGGTFPESTAKWEELTITLKKIGDSIPYSEEFKYDASLFADELQNFLEVNVKLVEDTQLLSGSGTGANTKGIYTYASAYTAVASGITDASIYDLIVKVAEDITKGKGNKFRPNFALMNITDINKMRLKKDDNNNYIMPPFVDRNGNSVAGITILEENGLAADTMVVGDSRYGKIYEDEAGYSINIGQVNNQFLEDMVTLKARKRLAFLIKNSEVAGFRKVTSIAADLVTLAS